MANLEIVFPNQDGRGTHVNISALSVTKYALTAKRDSILEYLTSDFAQRLFAEGNNEYPISGRQPGLSLPWVNSSETTNVSFWKNKWKL